MLSNFKITCILISCTGRQFLANPHRPISEQQRGAFCFQVLWSPSGSLNILTKLNKLYQAPLQNPLSLSVSRWPNANSLSLATVREEIVVVTPTTPRLGFGFPPAPPRQPLATLRSQIPTNGQLHTFSREGYGGNSRFSFRRRVMLKVPHLPASSNPHNRCCKARQLLGAESLDQHNQRRIHDRKFHATTMPGVIAGTEIPALTPILTGVTGASRRWRQLRTQKYACSRPYPTFLTTYI